MTLVFDRRSELAGQPMVHAMLAGVSEYSQLPPNGEPGRPEQFKLTRLESPALSAWEVCRWLVANQESLVRPLGTIRILLSPSEIEKPKLEPLPPGGGVLTAAPERADWAHFVPEVRAWRDDAARLRDNLTVFYYAGHGLERIGGTVLTLEDFTDENAGGPLSRAFELNANLIAGMGPSHNRLNMARSQFYFIDACREEIADKQGLAALPGTIWGDLPENDDRATPVFMATFPGAVALAQRGEPSDFAKALLACLEVAADNQDLADPEQRWPITSFTLNGALTRYFSALATGQYIAPTGVAFKDVPLRWLSVPPPVEFQLQVMPEPAIDVTAITLTRKGGGPSWQFPPVRQEHPYRVNSQAGIFQLEANGGPNYSALEVLQPIGPRSPRWSIMMRPPQ